MLAAVPLVLAWLEQVAPALPPLAEHLEAWRLLSRVVAYLFHCPNLAVRTAAFQTTLGQWHGRFVRPPQQLAQTSRSDQGFARRPGWLARLFAARPSLPKSFRETCELRALYPDAVKPKSHHILHLPEQVAAIGYAANCFAGERKHHWWKLLAERKFRGFERAVATEMLAICSEDWRPKVPGRRPS